MSKNWINAVWGKCAVFTLALLGANVGAHADDLLGALLRQTGQQLLQGVQPPPGPTRPAQNRSPTRADGGKSATGGAGDGPSFTCTRKLAPTEKAICADAELARLDRDLARAYTAVWTAEDDSGRASLKRDQRAWLAQRASCDVDRDCIGRMLKERTAKLFAQAGTVPQEPGLAASERSPARGAAEDGNAQTPAGDAAATARSSPTPFQDAPPADYRTLLAMMMDFRPDDYRSDDFAVYWYSWNLHDDSAECKAAYQAWHTEEKRPSFVRSVRSKLDDVLARASGAPNSQLLKLSLRLEASSSDYDSATGRLRLRPYLLRGMDQDQKFNRSPNDPGLLISPVSADHCLIGQSNKMTIRMLEGLSVSLDLKKIPEISLDPADVDARTRGQEIGKKTADSISRSISWSRSASRIRASRDTFYLAASPIRSMDRFLRALMEAN